MMPLLIGDFILVDDRHWENFLRLLKIEETQLAAYLALLTEEYLTEFSELHDRRLIPKQHYMVHYPTQIVRWIMNIEVEIKEK